MAAQRGTKHHKAKLTEDQVREIRRLHADGMSYMRIAEHLGWIVEVHTIIAADKRVTWRHVQ